jgi:hypothetical protein
MKGDAACSCTDGYLLRIIWNFTVEVESTPEWSRKPEVVLYEKRREQEVKRRTTTKKESQSFDRSKGIRLPKPE